MGQSTYAKDEVQFEISSNLATEPHPPLRKRTNFDEEEETPAKSPMLQYDLEEHANHTPKYPHKRHNKSLLPSLVLQATNKSSN